MTRIRRLFLVLLCTATLLLGLPASAYAEDDTPAAAAGPPGVDTSNPQYPEGFPDQLKKFVWGTPEFNERYANKPCSSSISGKTDQTGFHAGQYLLDMAHDAGGLVTWSAKAAGQELDNFSYQNPYDEALFLGGVANFVPSSPKPFEVSLKDLCAQDLAGWSEGPDPNSVFGFKFASKPDAGSSAYILQHATSWPGTQEDLLAATEGYPLESGEIINGSWNHLGPIGVGFDAGFTTGCDASINAWACQMATFLDCSKINPAIAAGIEDAPYLCNMWNLVTAYTMRAIGISMIGTQSDSLWDAIKATVSWVCENVPVVNVVCAAVTVVVAAVVGFFYLAYKVAEAVVKVISCAVSDDGDKCLAAWFANGTMSVLELIPQAASSGAFTISDLTNAEMTTLWNNLSTLAGYLVLMFLLGAVIMAAIRLRWGDLIQSAFGLVKFGFAMALGLTMVGMLVTIVNAISDVIAGSGGTQPLFQKFYTLMQTSFQGTEAINGIIIVAVVGIFAIIAAAVIWIQMTLRSAWIMIVMTCMVLQAAGLAGWSSSRKWVGQSLNALWLVLLVQPVTVLVFRVAVAIIGGGDGLGSLIKGTGALLVAAFAPFALVKLFSMVGEQISANVGGMFGGSTAGGGAGGLSGNMAGNTFARNAPGGAGKVPAFAGMGGAGGAGAASGAGASRLAAAAGPAGMAVAGAAMAAQAVGRMLMGGVATAGGVHGDMPQTRGAAMSGAGTAAVGGAQAISTLAGPSTDPAPDQNASDSSQPPAGPAGGTQPPPAPPPPAPPSTSGDADKTPPNPPPSTPGASSDAADSAGVSGQQPAATPATASPPTQQPSPEVSTQSTQRPGRPILPPVPPGPAPNSAPPAPPAQAQRPPRPPMGPAPSNGRW